MSQMPIGFYYQNRRSPYCQSCKKGLLDETSWNWMFTNVSKVLKLNVT